jgi:hypothetical protein
MSIDRAQLQQIASELVNEAILVVEPKTIRLHTLTIPRENLIMFHMALCAALNGDEIVQALEVGYSTELLSLSGPVSQGWRITANADAEQTILLTRKLMTELVEILEFFLGETPPAPLTAD